VATSGADGRGRYAKIAILLGGLALASFLALKAPREQHVRFVLGDSAPEVTGLDVQYLDSEGDVAREARLTYALGAAPRVVSHEPELRDGAYRVKVDVAIRDRRVSVERSVTLGGGSTQIDLTSSIVREKP
jgi:hypothetical protein